MFCKGAEINLDPEIPGAPSRPVRIIGQQKKIVEARCVVNILVKGEFGQKILLFVLQEVDARIY